MLQVLGAKLWRSKGRFFILLCILTLAMLFFSLSMQLYMQSIQSAGIIEESTTTIAIPQGYSLLIRDTQYLKLTREAEKNLAIMQLMQPILYLCALGAGGMLVVMQMRGRKTEMAAIRSLGASRLRMMGQNILEYTLICLPVTLFALVVWREMTPMTVIGVWLAFMAGAMCTIVRFGTIPLARQIRELEE